MPIFTIAIIGSGFSGTMVAYNLVNLTNEQKIRIILVEKSEKFAQGVAYSTKDPYHFLNVRAQGMGALSKEPEHFIHWLKTNTTWKKHFPSLNISKDSFLPRSLYALYLNWIFEETKKIATLKKIEFVCISGEATSIKVGMNNTLRLAIDHKQELDVNAIVLATNLPAFLGFNVDSNLPKGTFTENMWLPIPESILRKKDLAKLDKGTKVAIIGTGLTMVDAAISLIKGGFDGEIIAISKHGELPEPHLIKSQLSLNPFECNEVQTLNQLFRLIRKQISIQKKLGIDWRYVIDSLRTITVSFWKKMSSEDKCRFVRHLMFKWNKFRHRIAPKGYSLLQQHINKGKLHVMRGSVKAIEIGVKGKICVVTNKKTEIDFVINCSGAQLDIGKTTNPLLKNLYDQGLILPSLLNLGIKIKKDFRVEGNKNLPIYALGQLLVGERLETVAVPELREQSALVAKEIIDMILMKGKDSLA
jgi:uncharacterized NAD(P)/FAD-binding protein YdhS